MTREEVIEILKAHHMWTGEPQEIIDVRKENEALEMAIRALENHDTFMKYAYSLGKHDALSQEPCDDAISRDAVKELIKCGVSTDTYDDVEQVCKWIDALPSVTHKSGKWIDDGFYAEGHSHKAFHCSMCGHNVLGFKEDLSKYCPNCGAKMESEE